MAPRHGEGIPARAQAGRFRLATTFLMAALAVVACGDGKPKPPNIDRPDAASSGGSGGSHTTGGTGGVVTGTGGTGDSTGGTAGGATGGTGGTAGTTVVADAASDTLAPTTDAAGDSTPETDVGVDSAIASDAAISDAGPDGPVTVPTCGDNVRNSAAEECDNGAANTNTPVYGQAVCSRACKILNPRCGDSVVQKPQEACDEGPMGKAAQAGKTGCTNDCKSIPALPLCGNGKPETGEECDNGDNNSKATGDYSPVPPPGNAANVCNSKCMIIHHYCGDNTVDPGEECDGGRNGKPATPGSVGCDKSCKKTTALPVCGDGKPEGNEECDEGAAFNRHETSDYSALPPAAGHKLICSDQCKVIHHYCGDKMTDAGKEQCDLGPSGMAPMGTTAGCTAQCMTIAAAPHCGDGVIDNGEMCDDGAKNTDTPPYNVQGCSTKCMQITLKCGDGKKNGPEECDPKDPATPAPTKCTDTCMTPTTAPGPVMITATLNDMDLTGGSCATTKATRTACVQSAAADDTKTVSVACGKVPPVPAPDQWTGNPTAFAFDVPATTLATGTVTFKMTGADAHTVSCRIGNNTTALVGAGTNAFTIRPECLVNKRIVIELRNDVAAGGCFAVDSVKLALMGTL